MPGGISWVLLVSGHLFDPWAEEGPQCRSSLTWQIFQCSWNEFYFKMRWAVTLSASKHLQSKCSSPCQAEEHIAMGESQHWWGHPGVTHCPSSPLPTQGKQASSHSQQQIHHCCKNTAAFTSKRSLLSLTYLYMYFPPFYSLQTIVHLVILENALKKSIFGLRILKYFFLNYIQISVF